MKRVLVFILCLLIASTAAADSLFVLCQPDSFVNVREFPRKGSEIAGRVELGDELETDGIRKNGYIHVCGFEGGAWIAAGFVTDSPVIVKTVQGWIQSNGRVACRRSIKGTRRKWVCNGQNVTIYAFSDDWSITDKGFIQTRFLGGLNDV